jgi:WD40 repeat protein
MGVRRSIPVSTRRYYVGVLAILMASAQGSSAQPSPEAILPLDPKGTLRRSLPCSGLEFSSDGTKLAVRHELSERYDRIRVYSVKDKSSIAWDVESSPRYSSCRPSCAFDRGGDTLYFMGKGSVQSRSLTGGKSQVVLKFPSSDPFAPAIGQLALTERDKGATVLALDSEGRRVAVFDGLFSGPSEMKRGRAFEYEAISCTVLNKDRSLLLVAYCDGPDLKAYRFEIIALATGDRIMRCAVQDGEVSAGGFSADGGLIVTGTEGGILACYETKTGTRRFLLTEAHSVSDVEFHPERNWVAYSTRDRGESENVRIVDLATGKVLVSFNADRRGVRRVRFSSDGRQLATAGAEDEVRIWSVAKLVPE